MPQQKPWEKYSQPSGPVFTDPTQPFKAPQAEADLRFKGVSTDNVRDEIRNRSASLDNTKSNQRIGNTSSMRDNFQKLPEVQRYKIALYNAQRAMGTAANPQGDLALTYAIAQAMDPLGSVREGDQASIAGTQPAIPGLVEKLKKQFGMDGAGAYTPEARKALRREVFNIIASYKPQYDARRADAADFAKSEGINPTEVLGRDDTEIYAPAFRKYGEINGDDGTISRIVGGEPIKGAIATPEAKTGMAGYGATETSGKIPPAMQQEAATYLNQNWGKLDPQAWSDYRAGLDRKYGFNPDPIAYMNEAPKMNEFAVKGGRPDQMGAIVAPKRDMSGIEQTWNNAVANPIGAAVATTANGAGFGIPSLLAGDKFDQLRGAFPKSSMAGDIAGGVIGAKGMGGLFKAGAGALERKGATTLADTLAKPLVSDMAFGGTYGANDAAGRGQNPLFGAGAGMLGAGIGNKVGNAIGRTFPKSVGMGGEISSIDNSVPSSQELKDLAGSLYRGAEAKGLTATPDETFALNDSLSGILSKEGRLSPSGRLTEVQPKVAEAYKLAQDYAGEPMAPTQFQALRGLAADGAASVDPGERRIGSMMLDSVDNWSDATNPDFAAGLRDARGVASRYLQGDKITKFADLAEPGGAQYSQSGMGNALRTQYRQLDRAITKGQERFAPNVEEAVRNVARGTPGRNALRYVGKLAPTGQMGMFGYAGATGAGLASGSTTGTAVPVGLAMLGGAARHIEGGLAKRAAKVAELSAYGGQEYTDRIAAALERAGTLGGQAGAGATSTTLGPMTAEQIRRGLLALQASRSQ